MSIGPNSGVQAMKTSFRISITLKVTKTTPSQTSAPRRQPCIASTMAIAKTTGSITA